jgi:hypothetical protein
MAFTAITIKDGNNASQSMGALQDTVNSANYPLVSLDSARSTYRTSALFTPFATAPVTYISIVGSATKTVRVQRIGLWMVATANASVGLTLARGTALGTGGTAVTPTVTKLDTSSAASTAVVKHYTTAAQTAATGSTNLSTMNLTGNLVAETVQIFAPAAYSMMFPEGGVGGQCIVVRGTSDIIEVQVNLGQSGGANGPPAMQVGYFVEWVEDAS